MKLVLFVLKVLYMGKCLMQNIDSSIPNFELVTLQLAGVT